MLGDFNVVFGPHEKMGIPPIQISCLDFQNAIEGSNLCYVDSKGVFSTWARMGAKPYVKYKLDIFFCSKGCLKF